MFGEKDNDAEDRFGKALKRLVEEVVSLRTIFPDMKELGTHSNRKGSVSFVLMFVVISVVAVYLRAGWSLGNTQDRYIFGGAGGDQIVGRAVSGLSVTDTTFCTLPPHFSAEDDAVINTQVKWESLIEDYHMYPTVFLSCIPYFFPADHPLFATRLFTSRIRVNEMEASFVSYFKDRILTGIGRCKNTGKTQNIVDLQ